MLLRYISSPLRAVLVKLHPYFTCCASCGEIKVPLGGRLCTSLAPAFVVDAVLLGAEHTEKERWQKMLPFVRRVHQVEEDAALSLPTLPDLEECFFVAFPQSRINRLSDTLDLFTPNGIPLVVATQTSHVSPVEEVFCNFLESHGLLSGREATFSSDIYVLTKEYAVRFNAVYLAFQNAHPGMDLDYFSAFSRWAYASALAIPAGISHPLMCNA